MMPARRLSSLLILLPALLWLGGCASSHPRLTLFVEHDGAETCGGVPRQRTNTDKAGASISVDLP